MDLWFKPEKAMPEEHDSVFAKYKNTSKWKPIMFERISDEVLVTVQYEINNQRHVYIAHTIDGKWKVDTLSPLNFEVVAWMPFPKPCEL